MKVGTPRFPLKVFVASPDDVMHLRARLDNIFQSEYNAEYRRIKSVDKFNVWMWETSKNIGYTGDEYQKKVFEEFGDWCDIFILILWTKIGGGGTEAEYAKFIDEFKKKNPNIILWAVVYREPVSVDDIDPAQLTRLNKFLNKNENKWSALGRIKRSIKTVDQFETELRKAINGYLDKLQ